MYGTNYTQYIMGVPCTAPSTYEARYSTHRVYWCVWMCVWCVHTVCRLYHAWNIWCVCWASAHDFKFDRDCRGSNTLQQDLPLSLNLPLFFPTSLSHSRTSSFILSHSLAHSLSRARALSRALSLARARVQSSVGYHDQPDLRCNTLQHTATHCNTLQHTPTRSSAFS